MPIPCFIWERKAFLSLAGSQNSQFIQTSKIRYSRQHLIPGFLWFSQVGSGVFQLFHTGNVGCKFPGEGKAFGASEDELEGWGGIKSRIQKLLFLWDRLFLGFKEKPIHGEASSRWEIPSPRCGNYP